MYCEKCGKVIQENFGYCDSCKNQVIPGDKNIDNNILTDTINTVVVRCQCGQKLEANWQVCPQCNTPITVKITTAQVQISEKKENSLIYIIIFLACIILGSLFKEKLGGVLYFIALVTMVTAKINCPNSRAIKVLFWLMIFYIIIGVIMIMWMMFVCSNSIQSCSG